MREIPDAAGSSDDELSTSDEESIDPEESEQVVEEDVSSLIGPGDCCDQRIIWMRSDFSYRENVDC